MYADDTLVFEGDERVVKAYMDSISAVGKEYGLTFNWSKLEVLRVRHEGHVKLPAGGNVKEKDSHRVFHESRAAQAGRLSCPLFTESLWNTALSGVQGLQRDCSSNCRAGTFERHAAGTTA